ncbi:MAG: acyl-ACP thioesterase domain-containing protein [Pseudomonadota bacterium]
MKTDSPPPCIFEKHDRISYSNIGSTGHLKIVSILNYLQDAASEHAYLMGASGFDLATQNLAWVISRYELILLDNPDWQEEICIKTWRTPWKNLYEIRQFSITGKQDRPILDARAAWVMVKRENSRPVRLSRFLPETSWENQAGPLVAPQELFSDLGVPARCDFSLPFKIRMHDLDLNGHVNNAIYVEWAVETVPESMLSAFSPNHVRVSFHRESFYGDGIISITEIIEHPQHPETVHAITRKDGNVELARVSIRWKPMDRNGGHHVR